MHSPNRAERRKRKSEKRKELKNAIKTFRKRARARIAYAKVSAAGSQAPEGSQELQKEAAE
jgi:hypothetical protein